MPVSPQLTVRRELVGLLHTAFPRVVALCVTSVGVTLVCPWEEFPTT